MKVGKALTSTRSEMDLSEVISEYFSYNGQAFPFNGAPMTTLGSHEEQIRGNFQGYVEGAYKSNGVVFACMLARMLLFSEARFQFRRRVLGRPGELFGSAALKPLEEPQPGQTTGNLLTRIITDADLGGNWFGARQGGRICRLRPDWVTIILGSNSDPDVGFGDADAEVLGYVYEPGGPGSGKKPVPFLRSEVAHFAPIPDPLAAFRGMSWLTPVVREVMGDSSATTHKLKFFEQGATPNMVVSLDAGIQKEAFEEWLELFSQEYEGAENAYKTMYLGAGAKAEVVGADLKGVDFKQVQGAGETRIAAAAGVPPVVVGLSEGLEAATYSNYASARRRFADLTMRPLWRDAAGALATIISVPAGAELFYDERDISFLQEDLKDEAEIQVKQATTIKQLVDSGYDPDSVIMAVDSNDLTRLKHSGLYSVQLQPPGTEFKAPQPELPPGED